MTAAPFTGQGWKRADAHRQVIRAKQTDRWRPCSGTKPIWLTPPSKTGSGQACWQSTQLQPICATAHPQGQHSVLCSRLCCADQVVGEGFPVGAKQKQVLTARKAHRGVPTYIWGFQAVLRFPLADAEPKGSLQGKAVCSQPQRAGKAGTSNINTVCTRHCRLLRVAPRRVQV
jgi:hypothetical protein